MISHMMETTSHWVESRLQVLSWCVLALAFALRLQAAAGTFLNPDEVQHVLLSNQHSVAGAYRESLTSAHPPLFFVVLYFWRWLGTSEFTLRLLPVLAGTAAAWIASRWLTDRLGRTAGFAALLMLSFSPCLITLDAEVRAYSTLLLFMASALYWVERLFRAPSLQASGWLGLCRPAAPLSVCPT
jgi:predicted membrane-bound mannosyltransferase